MNTDRNSSALIKKDCYSEDVDSFLSILNEIKNELLEKEQQLQAESYEDYFERETNSIIENLLNMCILCGKIVNQVESNVFCQECGRKCFCD